MAASLPNLKALRLGRLSLVVGFARNMRMGLLLLPAALAVLFNGVFAVLEWMGR